MKSIPLTILIPCITFWVSATSGKELKTSDAPFLTPEEAVAKMEVEDKFEISIYAAEPDIGEPIAFTFDGKGRIWVVENYNYVDRRNHKEGEELTRIQIFEDTDGDGVHDTKKLFTDELTFSSGIAIGMGGVYVGMPPYLAFIPDADGDDQPDGPPEVLLDGWGIQDRHETLNSFIWGPDGWLYGCHGVFTTSMVGKPGDKEEEREFIDGGIWRYHPTKDEFEVFARGLSNPWGFDFNDEGQGFATCCVIPHLFHVVQGGYYHKQSKPHINPYVYDYITTIRDHTHRSAHGGARFYLADTFPEEYHNHLFMCNIHQHQVLTDYMPRKGSSFIGSHGFDFVTTNDLAWVGFSILTGPEGGVYVLDWHDTDICGNAINFPDSGRIYQIMPKGVDPIKRPDIPSLSDLELAKLQLHRNDWYVRQARTELQYRAHTGNLDQASVYEELLQQFGSATTSGKRLRALWALHVTGGKNENDLTNLLDHEDEYVRAWAIQFLSEDRNLGEKVLTKFATMAKEDPSPVVRLYLTSALQRIPFEQRWEILSSLVTREEDVEDNNIPRMLWFALEPMVPDHPEKALQLANKGKFPKLLTHTTRRLVSGSVAPPGPKRGGLTQTWIKDVNTVAPGFRLSNVSTQRNLQPRMEESFRNEPVLQTHPLNRNAPAVFSRHLNIAEGVVTKLKMRVSYHPHGDWNLRVIVGDEVLDDRIISYGTIGEEWLELEYDLSKYAGEPTELSIENGANDWKNEFGFWSYIKIFSEENSDSGAKK